MSDLPENCTVGGFCLTLFSVFFQGPLCKHSVGADGADECQRVSKEFQIKHFWASGPQLGDLGEHSETLLKGSKKELKKNELKWYKLRGSGVRKAHCAGPAGGRGVSKQHRTETLGFTRPCPPYRGAADSIAPRSPPDPCIFGTFFSLCGSLGRLG